MGVGRRLVNLVRANLNALIEPLVGDARVEELTDEELELELERRRDRRRREEEARRARLDAERAAQEAERRRRAANPQSSAPRSSTGTRGSTGPRSSTGAGAQAGAGARAQAGARASTPGRPPSPKEHLASLYALLETPVGADLETVKRSFRRLMRQHHPDVHAASPAAQRAATERSQRITAAFAELERHLAPRR